MCVHNVCVLVCVVVVCVFPLRCHFLLAHFPTSPPDPHCTVLVPTSQGEVLINGFKLDLIREEFRSNTGYLMQLTSPFYEELTVRENLTLAAQLRLPGEMTARDRFDRVEKVLWEVSRHLCTLLAFTCNCVHIHIHTWARVYVVLYTHTSILYLVVHV